MDLNIITQGDKLKAIRSKYNMRQHELTKEHISRNMISMIENDKANLVESTAKLILESVEEICDKNNLECDLTLEYLMDSAEEQAKRIAEELKSIIDETPEKIDEKEFKEEFLKAITILDKYKLKECKAHIYVNLGKYYRDICEYAISYNYYTNAQENFTKLFNNIEFTKVIINISHCFNNLKKHKEAVEILYTARLYYPELPLEYSYMVSYNSAVNYKQLNDFDSTQREILFIEKELSEILDSNTTRKVNLMNLKGNCYRETKSYNSAIQVYEEALILSQDNTTLQLLTLGNILVLYKELKDTKNILNHLKKISELTNDFEGKIENKYLPEFLYEIGSSCYLLEDYDECKIYLKKSIEESKRYNDSITIEKAIYKLGDIYSSENNTQEMLELRNELLECLSKKIIQPTSKASLIFIKYFNEIREYKISNDMIVFLQEV